MITEARKDDNGKAPWHLFPWDAAEQVVLVLKFGASKYAERNWEKGIVYSRVFAATQRHLKAWFQDREDIDKDSGLPHLACAACEVLFALAFHVRGMRHIDDRPGVDGSDAEGVRRER